MGMFNYKCSNKQCTGSKHQFDWMTGCIVEIGQVYVKGKYDGYGRVEVNVIKNSNDKETNGQQKDDQKDQKDQIQDRTTVIAEGYFGNQDDHTSLWATKIYCNGDGTAAGTTTINDNNKKQETGDVFGQIAGGSGDEKELLRQMCMMQQRAFASLVGGATAGASGAGFDDDYEEDYEDDEDEPLRFCIPKEIESKVLDELTEDLVSTLPTIADKVKKRAKIDAAAGAASSKKKKTTTTTKETNSNEKEADIIQKKYEDVASSNNDDEDKKPAATVKKIGTYN